MYWADKVASLSTETEDVNILGQALVSTKQYHRAATILTWNNCVIEFGLVKQYSAKE